MCKREYSQKGIVTLKKKACVKKACALERSMEKVTNQVSRVKPTFSQIASFPCQHSNTTSHCLLKISYFLPATGLSSERRVGFFFITSMLLKIIHWKRKLFWFIILPTMNISYCYFDGQTLLFFFFFKCINFPSSYNIILPKIILKPRQIWIYFVY